MESLLVDRLLLNRILSPMTDLIARLNAALEGRYAIDRQLGEGGMATVYLAEDVKHERSVALKVLKPELAAERVWTRKNFSTIASRSPDGRRLVLGEFDDGDQGRNIPVADLEDDSVTVHKYLNADWNEYEGAISPNGRYMAYSSNELGREHIFVRGFPEPEGQWQISAGGDTTLFGLPTEARFTLSIRGTSTEPASRRMEASPINLPRHSSPGRFSRRVGRGSVTT